MIIVFTALPPNSSILNYSKLQSWLHKESWNNITSCHFHPLANCDNLDLQVGVGTTWYVPNWKLEQAVVIPWSSSCWYWNNDYTKNHENRVAHPELFWDRSDNREKCYLRGKGGVAFLKVFVDRQTEKLFIVKHNLLPVNTTIILILVVLVLIHN